MRLNKRQTLVIGPRCFWLLVIWPPRMSCTNLEFLKCDNSCWHNFEVLNTPTCVKISTSEWSMQISEYLAMANCNMSSVQEKNPLPYHWDMPFICPCPRWDAPVWCCHLSNWTWIPKFSPIVSASRPICKSSTRETCYTNVSEPQRIDGEFQKIIGTMCCDVEKFRHGSANPNRESRRDSRVFAEKSANWVLNSWTPIAGNPLRSDLANPLQWSLERLGLSRAGSTQLQFVTLAAPETPQRSCTWSWTGLPQLIFQMNQVKAFNVDSTA